MKFIRLQHYNLKCPLFSSPYMVESSIDLIPINSITSIEQKEYRGLSYTKVYFGRNRYCQVKESALEILGMIDEQTKTK